MAQATSELPVELLDQQDLPFSLEAEQSVLGAVLVDADCLNRILNTLRPESFYRREHQELFRIFIRLYGAVQPIDYVTVLDLAVREEVFPSEGDARVYLAELVAIVPSTKNVEKYAEIVEERHQVRELIMAAHEIIGFSRSGESAGSMIDAAEHKIYSIREDRSSKLTPVRDIIVDVYDRLQRLYGGDTRFLGIPTGFSALDRVITGLNRSDLILLAARPAMGKTSFALNIAANVAMKADKTVAMFSLEMSKEQLVERLMSADALVQGNKMRTGELTAQEWMRLATVTRELAQAKILVDDTASLTVPEMMARLRQMRELDVVIIDYLQLMNSTIRSDNRVSAVSEITRSLKVMAKELDVPVIVLSQLSRGPESRPEHRPVLSDLRDSGSIEQDADLVLFLYRDAYYNRDSEEQNVAECIVAKNRHGETDTVKLAWDGEHTRFSGLEIFRNE